MLDVGCGGLPKGTVNCDRYRHVTPHAPRQRIGKTQYFVQCSAEYLPFRSGAFKVVHASHLLEHLPVPPLFLQEAARVAQRFVYLKVPSLEYHATRTDVPDQPENPLHLYTWSRFSLTALLTRYFPRVHVFHSRYRHAYDREIMGRVLPRLWIVGKLIAVVLRQFYASELVAVCYVT